MNILVTGANGFVGRALCKHIASKGSHPYGLVRTAQKYLNVEKQFVVRDYLNHSHWHSILKGMDAVIHTAGLAHVKGRPDKDYYDINTELTKMLALECAKANVKRFVYISSIAVYGVSSSQNMITSTTPLNPTTPYGHSKLLAEEALRDIERNSNLEVVIVRPPLVYGPNPVGNALTLLKAIQRNIPLPFAKIHNKRSMVFVSNLADALLLCSTNPEAKGSTFFVSDDHPLSIEELIRGMASAMGKKANLFYFPQGVMKLFFQVLGKNEVLEKITGSLELDVTPIQKTLGWKPMISVEEGLMLTAQSFQECTRK